MLQAKNAQWNNRFVDKIEPIDKSAIHIHESGTLVSGIVHRIDYNVKWKMFENVIITAELTTV